MIDMKCSRVNFPMLALVGMQSNGMRGSRHTGDETAFGHPEVN